jgi:hypothetical protein
MLDQRERELCVSLAQRDSEGFTDRALVVRFVGNPYVVAATKNDHQVFLPDVKSTSLEPLPAYLSQSAPPAYKPNPNSSSAIGFPLSIKGMRKELRKAGAGA